jgi:hypothetical protein
MALDRPGARRITEKKLLDGNGLNGGDEFYVTSAAVNAATGPGGPQMISLTGTGVYTQNFDTLSAAAADTLASILPTDWFFSEAGTNANTTYRTNTGSGSTGDTISYGAALASDRAFGGLQSGSLVPTIGATFTNNTGDTITSLFISYFGEQWRLGVTGGHTTADKLDFQISFDATSLTTGSWTDVNQLDFTAPNTGTAGALDGNSNRTAVSFTITGAAIPSFSIANGATFWIRWNSFDASGADDGLAIDDFNMSTPGSLAIDDVTMAEGAAGTTSFTFTVTRTGGSVGAVGATWTLTLSGDADAADFTVFPQTGLVSFADGSTTAQTITITVQGDLSVEANELFTVVLSNATGGVALADASGQGTITNDDAPVPPAVDLDSGEPGTDFTGSFVEDGAAAAIGNGIAVTQGSLPITGATITITDPFAGDALSVSGTLPATITILSNSGTVLTLTGTGTAADWEAALALVRYSTSSDNPTQLDGERNITVTLSDGVTTSTPALAVITITPVNDAPVLGGLTGDSVTFTEGDPFVYLDNNAPLASVTDADHENFAGGFLQVGVMLNPPAEDEFFVAPAGNVGLVGSDVYVDGEHIGTISSGGPGQILRIDFNGNATPAAVSTLLGYVAYRNVAGDNPTAGDRQVTWLLNDGAGEAGVALSTVSVVAVNDAPTSTNLHGDAATWTENGPGVALDVGGNATLADADSTNFAGGILSVSVTGANAFDGLFVTAGGAVTVAGNTVSVDGVQIATFTGGGFGLGNLVFTFDSDATPARVATLIGAVTYSNNGGDNPIAGTKDVTWVLYDGDGSGPGGPDSLILNSSITVVAVNDAPTGTANTITIDEDGSHVFTVADFGFSDPDAGDSMRGVTIHIDASSEGQVFYFGFALTGADNHVLASDIDNGELVFIPFANANGDDYATFTFQVVDWGNSEPDPVARTMTLDVLGVNDEPVVTNLAGDVATFTEGDGFVHLDVGAPALAGNDDAVFSTLHVVVGAGAQPDDALAMTSGLGHACRRRRHRRRSVHRHAQLRRDGIRVHGHLQRDRHARAGADFAQRDHLCEQQSRQSGCGAAHDQLDPAGQWRHRQWRRR